tara:strand:+ start:39 stop:437 length:399 start_codon:yes stop_codon:yes gene_type:complete
MATHIVISNNDSINIDDSFLIRWVDKGNAMPALENTVHYVLWTSGQKEIQSKDASGNMTGNTDLNDTSDAVGSTTIADLLTWGETRKGQIETAKIDHNAALSTATDAWVADGNEADTLVWNKTWIDYDPHYS